MSKKKSQITPSIHSPSVASTIIHSDKLPIQPEIPDTRSYKEQVVQGFYEEALHYMVKTWEWIDDDDRDKEDEEASYDKPAVVSNTPPDDDMSEKRTSSKRQRLLSKRFTAAFNNRLLDKWSKLMVSIDAERSQIPCPLMEDEEVGDQSNIDATSEGHKTERVSPCVSNGNETKCSAKVTFINGVTYEGDILDRQFNGKGHYHWADGSSYEGDFRNGLATGFGILRYKDTSYYQGHVCNCILQGNGAFRPAASDRQYSGQWNLGLPQGQGWILYDNTGEYYQGEWDCGRKSGIGTRTYKSGSIYTGLWKDGKPSGEGMMLFRNRDLYKGEWKDGVPHGYGEYTWNACMNEGLAMTLETQYKGEWDNGQRHGFGVQIFGMDGTKMTGTFVRGCKEGPAIAVCGDGTNIDCEPLFRNDLPVHRHDEQLSMLKSGFSRKSKSFLDKRGFRKISTSEVMHLQTSKIASTFSPHEVLCSPVAIPFYGTPTELSLLQHMVRMQDDLMPLMSDQTLLPIARGVISRPSIPSVRLRGDDEDSFFMSFNEELRLLNKNLSKHYEYLRQLYDKFATLDVMSNCDCIALDRPLMSRLFLHQFLREINVYSLKINLTEFDRMLADLQDIQIESKHCPFERIYFWQFVHGLLLLCHRKYGTQDFFLRHKGDGIYHNMFDAFLKEVVKPNDNQFHGNALFAYKNLLPIRAVYELYKSLGEPHTVLKIIKATCIRADEVPRNCCLKQITVCRPRPYRHFVVPGTHIIFIPEDNSEPWRQEVFDETQPNPYTDDPFYSDLKVFRVLGIKKIIKCVNKICPNIKSDGCLIDINYEIAFLEFYEILLELAEELLKHKEMLQKIADDEMKRSKSAGKSSSPDLKARRVTRKRYSAVF